MRTLEPPTASQQRSDGAVPVPEPGRPRARLRRNEGLQALALAVAVHVALLAALQGAGEPLRHTAANTATPAVLDIRSLGPAAATAVPAAPAALTPAKPTPAPAPAANRRAAPAAPSQTQAAAGRGDEPFAVADRVETARPSRVDDRRDPSDASDPSGTSGARGATDPIVARAQTVRPAAVMVATGSAGQDSSGSEETAPVYPTVVPGDFRRTYTLKRGLLSGTGEMSLRTQAGRYELELRGAALGMEIIGMSSRGVFDAAGFAPERFVDRRRGRDRLAANFDRVQRRITYSGTGSEQPLGAGTQDRLSWMVQLSAIVHAAPQRFGPGTRITLAVSGARADLDLWSFSVRARQAVDTPAGVVAQALMLVREPRRPYDTQVEVWLDPSRHHLPVRARLTVLPGGETLELGWSGE